MARLLYTYKIRCFTWFDSHPWIWILMFLNFYLTFQLALPIISHISIINKHFELTFFIVSIKVIWSYMCVRFLHCAISKRLHPLGPIVTVNNIHIYDESRNHIEWRITRIHILLDILYGVLHLLCINALYRAFFKRYCLEW